MLEFLKKKYDKIEKTFTENDVSQLTTEELVEQIHEDFFTEVNRILESAKIMSSLDTQHQDLIDKSKRLKQLGFVNSKEVREAENEVRRLSKLREENSKKESLIRAINYFSVQYPQYKFITEESVKRICDKYGLVYSKIGDYIGAVPDKNLKHIEEFKIKSVDEAYLKITRFYHRWSADDDVKYINKQSYDYGSNQEQRSEDYRESYEKAPLEIAAPISDFNMKGKQVENFKLKNIPIPDPVVLKSVMFEQQKYYLIVTAWGPEASDADVVNERMN